MKFRLKQCWLCKGTGEAVIRYLYKKPSLVSTFQGKCHRCNGKGWDKIEEVKDELDK